MENPSVSPIEVINAAIQTHNPFANAGIVKEQDVWGKGFPDVPTLNAHASDTVFQAIEQVRTSQSSQDKVTSIAITAQYGVGKNPPPQSDSPSPGTRRWCFIRLCGCQQLYRFKPG